MTDPSTTLKDSKYVTANILLNKVFEVTVTAPASLSGEYVDVTMPEGVDVLGFITGTASATVKSVRVPEHKSGDTLVAEVPAVITVVPNVASTDCTVYVLIR